MFVKMFGLPPGDFVRDSLYLHKVSDKEYDCRLFLRRFVDQQQFQVMTSDDQQQFQVMTSLDVKLRKCTMDVFVIFAAFFFGC